MARVMAEISDEANRRLNALLPFGTKQVILGTAIEDLLDFIAADVNNLARYITRDVNISEVERVSVSRELLLTVHHYILAAKIPEGKQLAHYTLIKRLRKELGPDAT